MEVYCKCYVDQDVRSQWSLLALKNSEIIWLAIAGLICQRLAIYHNFVIKYPFEI